MSDGVDWLERLVEIEPPQPSEVIQEYDKRFQQEPQIWSDPEHDEYVYRILEHFCADMGRPLAGELLDLGCGNGHTLRYLADSSKGALSLTGLDFSAQAIKIAKSQAPAAQLYCADFLTWDIGRRFDFIISLGVVEHFRNPRAALRKATSLLKEQGIFYLEVPNCLWHGWSGRREGFRRHRGGSDQLEWHLRRSSWGRLIADANLYVVAAIRGPTPWTEFTWLLSDLPRPDISQYLQLQQFCQVQWRQARPRRIRHFRNIQKQRLKVVLQTVLGRLGLLGFARKFTQRI